MARTQNKTGRPPKLDDPKTVLKLRTAFELGYNISEACIEAGISRNTLYERMKGDDEFRDKIEGFQLLPNMSAKRTVLAEVEKGSLKAAIWWLEHRASSEFNTKADVKDEEASGAYSPPEMTQEEVDQLADYLIAKRQRELEMKKNPVYSSAGDHSKVLNQ